MNASKGRVLVTGGAGFIGSHVCDAYLRAGWSVTALDDLSSGRRENVPDRADFVELDVRSEDARELVAGGGFAVVNHHAAQIDVRVSVQRPEHDASINIVGLLNLLEAARAGGVRRVIYVSSGGVVYGDSAVPPVPEEAPKVPLSPYGVSKLTGELYLYSYRRVHGLESVSLRYSNVYGPRQDPHGEAGVVAIFSQSLREGRSLTVYGDGEQTRDYVYVDDVAQANLLATEVRIGEPGTIDDTAYNVGTGRETTVSELARTLMEVSGRATGLEHAPERPGELRRSALDPRKLMALGWEPRTSLEHGLSRTYAHITGASA